MLSAGKTAGDGEFSHEAQAILNQMNGSENLLTTSCSHALELAARLINLGPGDEVIVPAFTFVTSASSFLWNGARPVFADVREDTLNLDIDSARSMINAKTKAICLVHYGGVGAQPDLFAQLAAEHDLRLIEDSAHGIGATYDAKPLGTFGDLSTLSFHETKNIHCGEGGAITINDPNLLERAEILREKGTNRRQFLDGLVDKYTWVDNGSSWVLSDLLAAVLVGQLNRMDAILDRRIEIWERYNRDLADWSSEQAVRTPHVPTEAAHTGHVYPLRFENNLIRDRFIDHMRSNGIQVTFHYQSLNESPFGKQFLSTPTPMANEASKTLVRLPLFESLTDNDQNHVIDATLDFRA